MEETFVMTERELESLIEKAKHVDMTDDDEEEQRRSFAYGNANIENSAVTREVVNQAAQELAKARKAAK